MNPPTEHTALVIGLYAPMLGRHEGVIPDVFEALGPIFSGAGHLVRSASSIQNRYLRTAHIAGAALLGSRRDDVSIVHAYSGLTFANIAIAGRFSTLPTAASKSIAVLAGGGLPDLAGRRPSFVRRAFAPYDAVVSPSPYLAQMSDAIDKPVTVIPNPVDTPGASEGAQEMTSGFASGSPRLLWMRSFHPIYRPDIAVTALANLRRDGHEATLTMAGRDKGLQAETERLAVELGVAEHVRFPGFLDPAAKAREFAAHDAFLATNSVDNSPVSVVEAQAHGLCVVGIAAGGLPFLTTNGHDAVLIDDGADNVALAAEMAACIGGLVADPARATRIAQAGRASAAAAQPDAVLRRWEALFAGL